MKHVFYFVVALISVMDLLLIIKPKFIKKLQYDSDTAILATKGNNFLQLSSYQKFLLLFDAISTLIVAGCFVVGLCTFNWMFFLVVLIYAIALLFVVKNRLRKRTLDKLNSFWDYLGLIIVFLMCVSAILNAYLFKVDLSHIIISLF